MNVYHGLQEFHKLPDTIVTSGTFDGVHYGHQKILRRLQEIAEQEGAESLVITYWPHPRKVLQPHYDLKLISSLEEKIKLLEAFGIQHMLIIPFNKAFAQTSSEVFIKEILVEKINTHKLVIGYDHRFGKNREGSFEYLKANAHRFGFEVEEIPKQEIDEVAVSSTKVRDALLNGDVATAHNFLGRPYSLQGTVVKGEQIGRTMGFPTANIAVSPTYKLIPKKGIYAVSVAVRGEWHKAMLNIGHRPTFHQGDPLTIEAHLFDFDSAIYGEEVTIRFLGYLRDEMKFDSAGALRAQLKKDEQAAKQLLAHL